MTTTFKPILFSTEMVQAILDGRKTQTRRLQGLTKINANADLFGLGNVKINGDFNFYKIETEKGCWITPKFLEGDILWVRETFSIGVFDDFFYKATDKLPGDCESWKPSIHMPKAAVRIFLKVTNVRCERLQDISNEDAIAEGIYLSYAQQQNSNMELVYFRNYLTNQLEFISAIKSFETLWIKINGQDSWKQNPWVFVYEFEVIEKPENFLT